MEKTFNKLADGETFSMGLLRLAYGGKQAATLTVDDGYWIRRLEGIV